MKHTERAGEDTKDLQRALEVMCIIPKSANDMMNVGRLQGFEVMSVQPCCHLVVSLLGVAYVGDRRVRNGFLKMTCYVRD